MHAFVRRLVAVLGVAVTVAGIVSFGQWAVKTDFMFGHFKGPPEPLIRSVYLLSIGVAGNLAWCAMAVLNVARALRGGSPKGRTIGRGLLAGVPMVLLLVPSLLFLLIGVTEIPDARSTLRAIEGEIRPDQSTGQKTAVPYPSVGGRGSRQR